MKITKQNIQFIDNYLKNSEVDYYDIRMEMLDHVATAVEQKMQADNLDFYDAFKSYMVLNKRGLMEQNENTLKHNYQVIIPFLKYCLKPISLSIFVLCYTFFFYVIQEHDLLFVCLRMIWTVFLLMIVQVLFQARNYYFNQKKRFYSVEKNSAILFIVYQPLNLLNITLTGKRESATLFEGIIITFFLSWLIIFMIYNSKEKKRVENINKSFLP